jgi:hypothetical protein
LEAMIRLTAFFRSPSDIVFGLIDAAILSLPQIH